ncbi:hypothetical protein [Tahibacter amnicola]|uniref:Tripartite tricarboxylate transporter TctB family protein n=1 Tax=Tahibacter amnicola TaxID=2976241 RepID=A0ABY6BG00_9GAMM|nr:hypothetical protein [Tahibacter amnicola]UXI68944.1 hypothetical protein N4264_04615 [Tahibacter amnicola]
MSYEEDDRRRRLRIARDEEEQEQARRIREAYSQHDEHSHGQSGGPSNLVTAVVFCAVAGVAWTWENLPKWHTFDQPYKAIASFYYWLLIAPIKVVPWIWESLTHPGLSDYKNFNVVTAVAAVLLYAVALVIGGGVIRALCRAVGVRRWKTLLASPAIAAGLWFAGTATLTWLTQK